MSYDEVVEGSKRVKAPRLETDAGGAGTGAGSDGIIDALKVVDRRTRVSIRVLQGIFAFMILIAAGFIVVNDDAVTRSGVGLLILSFFLVIYMQQLRHKVYSETYLNAPLVEYLQRARQRMRVFTVRSWLAIPAWLLIDAGVCLLIYAGSDRFDLPVAYVILALQIPIVAAAGADFVVEYLIWRREHKPVVTRIDGILKDLESALVSDG
jgi:hypothetical protein